MFKRAIVRTPSKSMINGITTAKLGVPDYKRAIEQHQNYIKELEKCGLEVTVLEAMEDFPDSTFVEDVALLTKACAIITNPGANSRKGEINEMVTTVKQFYDHIEYIIAPGTVEAGDIMMVGSHFYIGLSERTNKQGAEQLIQILEKYQMTGSVVSMEKVLHLKTGLSYLENNNLVACGEFLEKEEFQKYHIIKIDEADAYSANCIWVNNQVLVPKGFPQTSSIITKAGYSVIEVDVSEFEKIDGGLSCLSLRF